MTGAVWGSRETMRLVMPRARPKFDTRTVAPCSCATRATAKPMELSIVTPATRIRLPSRMPIGRRAPSKWWWRGLKDVVRRVVSAGSTGGGGFDGLDQRHPGSVAHAEAAVDGNDRAGHVAGCVRPQPGDHGGDLVDGGV